jgi:hypothetical protein
MAPGASTRSMTPVAIARSGMLEYSAVAGSCARHTPPAARMSSRPADPSSPVPDSTTPAARGPASSASDVKKMSIVSARASMGRGRRTANRPSRSVIDVSGAMTYTRSAATSTSSATSVTRIGVTSWRISTRWLDCRGSRWRITTYAMPVPIRCAATSSRTACRPPADAPTPTTMAGATGVRSGVGRSESGGDASEEGRVMKKDPSWGWSRHDVGVQAPHRRGFRRRPQPWWSRTLGRGDTFASRMRGKKTHTARDHACSQ